jgi:hypothetical protein
VFGNFARDPSQYDAGVFDAAGHSIERIQTPPSFANAGPRYRAPLVDPEPDALS